MITSHRPKHTCQNYGYFSRSWRKCYQNSAFVALIFRPFAALRAELIRLGRVSGPGLPAGALLRGLSRPGARWGGTR